MNTVITRNFVKISCVLLALFFGWTGISFAVEAGSAFTINAGADQSLRTYTGTVTAGQKTLVAYERDILVSTDCYATNTATANFTIPTQPTLGTLDLTGPTTTGIDFQAYEDVSCGGVTPWSTVQKDARAIYYTADATASGTDTMVIQTAAGDTITIIATILPPNELGGVATISPILLQTSVKQTSSMISERIKRVIIPHTLFKDRAAPTSPPQNRPKPEEKASLTPDVQKRGLYDIVNITVDSKTIGLSAGDASMKHGIWTNIAYTSADDDSTVTESSMDINTYIIGYDYKLSDRMALGVAMTYEKINADLDFNNGDLEGDGYTVAPYFAMLLTDYLALDIIAGYAIVDYDQDRDFGVVTSSVDADRQFFEFSLNGFHYIDQWSFNLNTSFLYAHEGQDSYTESDGTNIKSNSIDFSQLSMGLEVAYTFKYMEPYITVAYEYDTKYEEITDASYDRNGGDGGLGCRFFFSDQLSGDVYGSTKFDRKDYDEYSVLGNIRYDF